MELEKALEIANKYIVLLKPLCSRISIAGSCRRKKSVVKDIEIVCVPLNGKLTEFVNVVNQWTKIKGTPIGKYTQRLLPEGIKLDLFIANKDNWGLQLAIRTGSAEFSHKVLASGWVKKGYKSKNGILWKDGKPTYIREEKELFKLIGIPYLLPEHRELEG